MTDKSFKIYSAIKPSIEKNVSAEELKIYSRCKFWKTSREEADIFYCLYMIHVHHGFPSNIVAILSEQLFKTSCIHTLFYQIKKLEEIYRTQKQPQEKTVISIFAEQELKPLITCLYELDLQLIQQTHLNAVLIFDQFFVQVLPIFFKIIDAIITNDNKSYPVNGLIDDVVHWAHLNKVIDAKTVNLIEKELATTRITVFNNTEEFFLKELVNLLIEHHTFIIYDDAQALLFPGQDLLVELKKAVLSGKIHAYSSVNDDFLYFHTTTLIKWLMKNAYLSEQLTNAFPLLKIESIKENKVPYLGKINSLQKFVQQGEDRNDKLGEALNGATILYLKYPRDLLKWRHYSYSSSLPKPKQMALQRYDGLGQLKKTKNDDSAQCQFGGLTIDMLFYGESPEHHLSKQIPKIDYEIEVVQTEEEACYGLQPYIKISAQQLASIVKDDNLIILDDNCLHEKEIKTLECNGDVSTSSNDKLNYTKPYISHHAKKRSLILKAASAVAYRYSSEILCGKSILALIKRDKNFLFEQSEIPRGDRTNIDLINDFLRPLEECDFNRKDYEQSQEEKLFGSALSIIFSKEETKIGDRSTATVTIAQKIFEKRQIIGCTFELNAIEQLLDDSFALIS